MDGLGKAEITKSFDGAGKDEAEGQDQGHTIVGAAKTNQCVGGIAEAEQRATDFEVKIRSRRPGYASAAEVEGKSNEQGEERAVSQSGADSAVLAEKPDDIGPIAQSSPRNT